MLDSDTATSGNAPGVLSQVADFRLTRFSHKNNADQWWSVLVEIEGSIDAFIANAIEQGQGTTAPNLKPIPVDQVTFVVPVAYDAADRAVDHRLQPVSIFARQSFLSLLNQQPLAGHSANQWNVQSLVLGGLVDPVVLDLDADWPDTTPHPPLSKGATVMAVIDDGIAIGHDLFRDGETSSRVRFAAFLESVPFRKDSKTTVGRTLNKEAVDALLEKCTRQGLLDEDTFYSRTGQIDFPKQIFSTVALRSSHGSHVMALAAGQMLDDAEDERPIICAALPSRLVEDTSGVDLLPSFYLGFQMLTKEARRFCEASGALAKVIFNLSYGNSGGPHDGTGLFARLFEHYFGAEAVVNGDPQRAWLMLPGGNANLAQLHGVLEPGVELAQFDLSVLPDDRTGNAVQIWMPFEGADPAKATVVVWSPDGKSHQVTTSGPDQSHCFVNEQDFEIARLSFSGPQGETKRGLVQLLINPTASHDRKEPLAPSGIWQIEVTREADAPHAIELWVRRDETIPGLKPGGKQAYFDNPGYERFGKYGEPLRVDPPGSDCPVKRAGTLSGFACGQSPVVVAAYVAKTEDLAPYSASGPCNQPSSPAGSDREGPDLAAKGDESDVVRGVLSAGSRSGTLVRRSGTSVAAPRMARAAAVAIHDFDGSGREWAQAPTASTPGMEKLNPGAPKTPQQSGSGAYSYPVEARWIYGK
ncbi:S8 family serine peptidase [Thalassococcus lentus]|uniref:S8 family serine peptidase n=1 Tax=Thalassococcus lentus TaxID=1210524 RepID=A0ABT4XUL3_9RHOB|nr:S8 family serine peptidase [Thalassococcus lentus]MDA7425640.1 S8 family serine peptidase [Thalassococcus lentus]